jgi:hypothetical protein
MPLPGLLLLFGLTVTSSGPCGNSIVAAGTAISPAVEEGQPQDADTAAAQQPAQARPPSTGIRSFVTAVIDDVKHLPSVENGYLTLMGAGLALGAHQVDHSFNAHLQSHDAFVNSIFAPAKYYGDIPEQAALSLGTYALGRIFDRPKVSHLALDLCGRRS